MLFNSIPYLVFFPTFVVLYFATRGTSRRLLTLGASWLFYGWWDWRFLCLLICSTFVDWWLSLRIARTESPRARKSLLLLSLVMNLGVLGFFKYFNFFADSFARMLTTLGMHASPHVLDVILPVGISFYTFQTLNYMIDVYRREMPVEKSFVQFATFVAFFPHLVAGPIVRARDFLPQLHVEHPFDAERFESGMTRVAWGFFKKIAIADSLAAVVDTRFAAPAAHDALSLTVGVVFYAFQIYADFSAYSDIAIGTARLLGIHFPENFERPYFATSFREFWRRWHISLSTWLRDYLYVSLGGNRGGKLFTYRNLILTMLLGGLWHGANWTFVIWGALHGGYLVAERELARLAAKIRTPSLPVWLTDRFKMVVVFSLVCVAWIFFRAPTLADGLTILTRIATLDGFSLGALQSKFLVVKGAALIVALLIVDSRVERTPSEQRVLGWPARAATITCCLWAIALLGSFDGAQFIYFQF